jgi:hypothetical protein
VAQAEPQPAGGQVSWQQSIKRKRLLVFGASMVNTNIID